MAMRMRSKRFLLLPELFADTKINFCEASTASHSFGIAVLSPALIQMNKPCGASAVTPFGTITSNASLATS